jgi:hypothetical protein
MLPRHHWQQHVATLDPETDYEEIYRIVIAHEFPWDLHQAMSFALFRTYAVPSIGRLLDDTGEFHRAPQKRYDDTVLLLDEPARAGLHSGSGRRAIRRINQMHGAYDISNQDMRYVLSTFVVVPKRWLDDFGWRALSPVEVRASVCYYRDLGRLMGIRDLPATYAGFEELLTSYEAEHFAYDEGGRRVADATMHLLTTFYPAVLARLVNVASLALLDDPLLAAFRYTRPPAPVRRLVRAALRARGRVVAMLPARRRPRHSPDMPTIRSYPDGYDVDALGTFPRGCPVPRPASNAGQDS